MWSVKIERARRSWSHIHSNRRMMKARAAENSITTVKGPAGLELVLWAGAALRADYGAEESLMLRMHRKTRRSAQKSLISLFEEHLYSQSRYSMSTPSILYRKKNITIETHIVRYIFKMIRRWRQRHSRISICVTNPQLQQESH